MIRALALSVCLFGTPAIAHDVHVCRLRADALHAEVQATAPDAHILWAQVTGESVRRILDKINALPPVGGFKADYIDVAIFPDDSNTMFFVSKNCVTFGHAFRGEDFTSFMTDALGEQS